VPKIGQTGTNFYTYKRVEGITLSNAEPEVFLDFLEHCKKFWGLGESVNTKNENQVMSFKYLSFYEEKTKKRVTAFLENFGHYQINEINGRRVHEIAHLLTCVPWQKISGIVKVKAHGDLHPDNILYNQTTQQFVFLDWRQDLAGETSEFGDLYYDLAKILHGLIVDHKQILLGKFGIEISTNAAKYWISQPRKKKIWIKQLKSFHHAENLDLKRTNLLTALIFLNIATLHHSPYNDFLFLLGHDFLDKAISDLSLLK
jgi:thiamine kinase-like enzyme